MFLMHTALSSTPLPDVRSLSHAVPVKSQDKTDKRAFHSESHKRSPPKFPAHKMPRNRSSAILSFASVTRKELVLPAETLPDKVHEWQEILAISLKLAQDVSYKPVPPAVKIKQNRFSGNSIQAVLSRYAISNYSEIIRFSRNDSA